LDIEYIIKDLLTRREGLVVPGLGSFISEFQPASIRKDKKIIQPPKKQFRFDPTVKADADNILAIRIAKKENITLQEAVDRIKKFTDNVHEQLKKEGSYTIEGLGTLEKKAEGVIDLRQAETPESTLGFEAIAAEPFELESPPEPTPVASSPPPAGKKSRKRRGVWITLLAVFLLLIGYAGWYTGFYDYLIYKWQQRQESRQVTKTPRQESPEKKERQPTQAESGIDKALEEMTDKKKALMYREEKDLHTYYLVAGSFNKYENAKDYRQQLRKKGYSPKILEKDGLYRVSVLTFDKKEDALVKLYQMRDTGRLQSIWLLSVREKDQ